MAELTAERDAIRRWLEFFMDHFDMEMKDLAERKIAELRAQLRTVNDRIARCRPATALTDVVMAERVDAVVAAIKDLAESLGTAPPPTLAAHLKVVIGRLVVDLETRDIELEIALPSFADATMWLEGKSACGVAGDSAHERHYRPPNRLGQSGPRGHHGSQFGVVKRRRAATVGGIGGGVRCVAVSACLLAAYARPGLIPKLDVVGSNPIARF